MSNYNSEINDEDRDRDELERLIECLEKDSNKSLSRVSKHTLMERIQILTEILNSLSEEEEESEDEDN